MSRPTTWWIYDSKETADTFASVQPCNMDRNFWTEIETVELSAYARAIAALKTIAEKETCAALYPGCHKYKNYEDGWEGVAEFARECLRDLGELENE